MTLGAWFREYVYIPLGGSRRGRLLQLRNILVVWMLTGIWHGAGWNFFVWGLYFAALLILEKLVVLRVLTRLPDIVAHFYALIAILAGWAIFAFDSLGQGMFWIQTMVGLSGAPLWSRLDLYELRSYGVLLLAGIIGSTPVCKSLVKKWRHHPAVQTVAILAVGCFCMAALAAGSYNPFLYFRF